MKQDGLGPKTKEFEEKFADFIGVKYAIGVNSATAGLHIANIVVGIEKGDEVIVPSMTFVSTALSVLHVGGGTTSQGKAHRLFYSLRSRLLYGFKHFSNQNAVLLLIITVVLEPVSRIAFSIVRGSFSDVRDTFNAYRMLFNWSLFKNS